MASRSWARWLLWATSLAVLGALLWWVDFEAVVEALRVARPGADVPALAGFVLVTFLLDATCAWLLFRWVAPELTAFEVIRVKGASSFVAFANYNLSHLTLVYYAHRTVGLSPWTGAGVLVCRAILDGVAIGALGTLGLLASSAPTPPWVAALSIGSLVTGLALIAILHWGGDRLTRRLPRADRVQQVFAQATFARVTVYLTVRCLYFSLGAVFLSFGLAAFDVHVTPLYLAGIFPVVGLIATFPVTLARLGATKAALVAALGTDVDSARVVAFCLFWDALHVAVYSVVGLVFLALSGGTLSAARADAARHGEEDRPGPEAPQSSQR